MKRDSDRSKNRNSNKEEERSRSRRRNNQNMIENDQKVDQEGEIRENKKIQNIVIEREIDLYHLHLLYQVAVVVQEVVALILHQDDLI
jgi:hypothetical protein